MLTVASDEKELSEVMGLLLRTVPSREILRMCQRHSSFSSNDLCFYPRGGISVPTMDRLRLSSIQLRKKGPEMPEREEEEDEGKDGTPLPASHRLMCIRDTCNVLSE